MRAIAFVLMMTLTGVAHADAAARARAALALAAARRPDPYADAYARALAEGRLLVVWVSCSDPAAEAATPEYVHVRVAAFPGVASACVVVAQPSKGQLWRVADLAPKAATPARLKLFAPARPNSESGGCRH